MNFKYNLKRYMAYVIDIFLVILVVQAINFTAILNPNYEKYINSSKRYSYYQSDYYLMSTVLDIAYEDEDLSTSEYETLISNNSNFGYLLVERYDDNKLSKEEYEEIKRIVKEDYDNNYFDIYYDALKNLWFYNITYIVAIILYFGVFNYFTKGQTLGKKILSLKITSISNENISLPIYILRSIILYSGIFYLINIATCLISNQDLFLNINKLISILENLVSFIIMISILFNKDNRGLHDIICKTKVIDTKKMSKE